MFDLYNSMEAPGEVEMVSLVPEDEPVAKPEPVVELEPVAKPEPIVEPEPVVSKIEDSVAMSRSYERDGMRVEIAYLNYNKVRIQIGDSEPEIKVFATSKEAVDYYVNVMQEYEIDE